MSKDEAPTSTYSDTRIQKENDPYAPPAPLPPLGIEGLACDLHPVSPPGFVTRQELCEIAGVTDNYLKRLASYGLMPKAAKYSKDHRLLYAESVAYEMKLNPPQLPKTRRERLEAFNEARKHPIGRFRRRYKRKAPTKEEVVALAIKQTRKQERHIGHQRTAAIFRMLQNNVPLDRIVIEQEVLPRELKVVISEYDQFTGGIHVFGEVARNLNQLLGTEIKDAATLFKAIEALVAKTRCPGVGCQRLRGLCTACARRSFRTAKDEDEDEDEDG